MSMIDENTVVIHGHVQITDKKGYSIYLDMLDNIRSKVLKGVETGDSLEKVIESKPTKEFDPIWGGGFLNPDKFTELVYRDLSR